MKKRAVALLLVTMLLISLFPAAAFGAGETPQLQLDRSNNTITVNVVLSDYTGVLTGEAEIAFPNSALTLTGVKGIKCSYMVLEDPDLNSANEDGKVKLGYSNETVSTEKFGGNIGTLTFTIKDTARVGTYSIALTSVGIYSGTYEDISAQADLKGARVSFEITEGLPAVPEPPAAPEEPSAEVVILTKEQRNAGTVGLQIGNYAAVKEGGLTWIDRDNKNVVPYIKNRRTMVPLRYISESLGADVFWDNDTRTATVKKDDKVIQVPIGADHYLVNGVKYTQDAPAEIVERRTFVPIRCIAEALACDVEWENTNRLVIIAPVAVPWDLNGETEQIVMNDWLLVMSPLLRDFV
ncbi:MAG: hypothetical protein IJO79_07515 [Firmicutes bacterium]|nr:hypothetical protein [Bacillota bacterium]